MQVDFNIIFDEDDFCCCDKYCNMNVYPDMEKGTDTQTLSVEISQNCGLWKIICSYFGTNFINWEKKILKYQIIGTFVSAKGLKLFPCL